MKAAWRVRKIGDYCEVIAGQSPEGKHYNSDGRGMPFYQGKKDFGDSKLKRPPCGLQRPLKLLVKTTSLCQSAHLLDRLT